MKSLKEHNHNARFQFMKDWEKSGIRCATCYATSGGGEHEMLVAPRSPWERGYNPIYGSVGVTAPDHRMIMCPNCGANESMFIVPKSEPVLYAPPPVPLPVPVPDPEPPVRRSVPVFDPKVQLPQNKLPLALILSCTVTLLDLILFLLQMHHAK